MNKLFLFCFLFISPSFMVHAADSLENATTSTQQQQQQQLKTATEEQQQIEKVNARLKNWEDDVDRNNKYVEHYLYWITWVVGVITVLLTVIIIWHEVRTYLEYKKFNRIYNRLIETEAKNESSREKAKVLLIQNPHTRKDLKSEDDFNLVDQIVKAPIFGKVDVKILGNPISVKGYHIVVMNAFDYDPGKETQIKDEVGKIYNDMKDNQGWLMCIAQKNNVEPIKKTEVWNQFSNNICTVYPNIMNVIKVRELLTDF